MNLLDWTNDADIGTRGLTFTIPGKAQTAGSKKSFVPIDKRTGQPFRRKGDGSVVVSTVDDNPKGREWKAFVKQLVAELMQGRELFTCPLIARVVFRIERPKSHYGTGKNAGNVKGSAPKFHMQKPDATKLFRCLEDACTGIAWHDDCQVVRQEIAKVWHQRHETLVEIVEARDPSPFPLDGLEG